jgi:ferredoxin/coenzyme F420-reducing hydrogenase delta subunit
MRLSAPRRLLRASFDRAEVVFDAAFGARANPLHQLGALGWFFYWVVAVSGIYLFIFFDTGVEDAYASVERITHEQWYLGGVMRSFHRYASDALVVVALLHLLREWASDRMRGPRWFAWVTGVALLWLLFAAGITGYWVVWDQLAHYVALASSEWLDALGVFGQSIAHNFVHDSTLSSRFFTLMAFIHIAVPLAMLFLMWIHIQRHSQPGVNPPRALALGTLGALLVLSFAKPALSHGPANLASVPADVALDWFYLAFLPLQDHFSGLPLWIAVAIATVLLMAMPWLPPLRRRPAAVVNLDECNGCARCAADCPYGAVSMRPRTDGASFAQEAVVSADLCVSCGLCVGACPTATPFSRRRALVAGVELPELPVVALRGRCEDLVAGLTGKARVLVIGCRHGVDAEALAGDGVAALTLPCAGMLPPPFLDFLIMRGHVDGVFLAGCADGACHERLGITWTRQRIAGERDPFLRARVPRNRLCLCFAGRSRDDDARVRLGAFRERLAELETRDVRAAPVSAEAD